MLLGSRGRSKSIEMPMSYLHTTRLWGFPLPGVARFTLTPGYLPCTALRCPPHEYLIVILKSSTKLAPVITEIDISKTLEETLLGLNLPPRPVILLLGMFDSSLTESVFSLCDRVVAPGALLVDDGKSTGIAAITGRLAGEQDTALPVLAIIPADRDPADIDPKHDLVLRLPKGWPEGKYVPQVIELLAGNAAESKPVIVILFGDAEKRLLIRCTRRKWPLLIIKGTGGLADQILDAAKPLPDGSLPPLPADPELREIVETARVYSFALEGNADDLSGIVRAQIDRRPETLQETLREAWNRFAELDNAAKREQAQFRTLQFAAMSLGVLAALFAILSKSVPPFLQVLADLIHQVIPVGTLKILLVLTPIILAIVTSYSSHFRNGNKWVLFRGSAEALKREVFRFRARAGVYSDEQCVQISREAKLATKVKEITSALEQSEANKASLELVSTSSESTITLLGPEDYLNARIKDQIQFFVSKTAQLSSRLRAKQTSIYVAGGAATVVAALLPDYGVWVALPTAIVTALTTQLQSEQVENSLVQYNQTLAILRNIEIWWTSLTPWEKSRQRNIDLLVDETEKALETELSGWVQKMQTTLDKLTEKESDPAK